MTAQTERRDTPAADTRAATIARTMASIGWPPVLLTLGALAILIWLGRDMTFYHDEFAFLLLRDLSLQGIFAPHNEHLSATLVILYRTLVGTVGTVSYWPYLGVTFALHVIVSAIVYVVVRRETTAMWALGAMAVAAVLLTIALATSGVAFAFLVGAMLHLALTRPRAVAWLALPIGLYLAWLVTFGATRMVAMRSPSLDGVPEYVLAGLVASAAGVVGSALPVVGSARRWTS